MKITKAIIPVAGWGTRRLPITKVIEKSMLPVGNRPIVDYVVEDCVRAGIKDIYLAIDAKPLSQVKSYYANNTQLARYLITHGKKDRLPMIETKPSGVNFHFYVQKDINTKYGTAAPVAQIAQAYALKETVAVLMGDDFIYNAKGGSDMKNLMALIKTPEDSAILGVQVDPKEVGKYGVLKVKDGLLVDLVEKPNFATAPSNIINISKYIMSAALLGRIVKYYKENHFGPYDQEYLITDPILAHVKSGAPVYALPATGQYLDGGSTEGWLHANNVVCGGLK
jgi:UTP--glucose-1-phosphate uridylyltransferase